jgi:hypothetical protein
MNLAGKCGVQAFMSTVAWVHAGFQRPSLERRAEKVWHIKLHK